MKKTIPITIANQKGGVGKTSATYNLAGVLSKNHKVLVCDLDPQGNMSSSFKYEDASNIKDIFNGETPNPLHTNIPNIDLLPSDRSLSGILPQLTADFDLKYKLDDFLKTQTEYDYILIDTPPTIGNFSLCAAIASKYFLVPISTQYYTMQGTSDLLDSMEKVKERLNPDLSFLGACISIHDKRTALSKEILANVKSKFNGILFETIIPKAIAVEESQVFKEPLAQCFPKHEVTKCYQKLTQEIIERINNG